jgi:aspartate racemase
MSPYQPRCIGLVGGLGPAATIYYYNALLRAHAELGVKPDMVVVHAEVTRVLGLVRDGDITGLAHYLAGFVERLRAAAQRSRQSRRSPRISARPLCRN